MAAEYSLSLDMKTTQAVLEFQPMAGKTAVFTFLYLFLPIRNMDNKWIIQAYCLIYFFYYPQISGRQFKGQLASFQALSLGALQPINSSCINSRGSSEHSNMFYFKISGCRTSKYCRSKTWEAKQFLEGTMKATLSLFILMYQKFQDNQLTSISYKMYMILSLCLQYLLGQYNGTDCIPHGCLC